MARLTLMASAAMLQGKLSRGLPPFVSAALGLQNDAERALQQCWRDRGLPGAGRPHSYRVRIGRQTASSPTRWATKLPAGFAKSQDPAGATPASE